MCVLGPSMFAETYISSNFIFVTQSDIQKLITAMGNIAAANSRECLQKNVPVLYNNVQGRALSDFRRVLVKNENQARG